MERKFLEELGLEKDVIDRIMAEYDRNIEGVRAELEEANKAAGEAHRQGLNNLKIDNAVEKALISFRAKTPKAVKAMLDMTGVKIDKESAVIGIDEQLKAISEAKDTKYLFEGARPKLKGTAPGYGSGSEHEPKSEDMTYSEMFAF
ncbi:MAG: phage scaffolding protein [Clostridiales bacterium]|nr:phage scaffolding protein [Clostridiales bacterium]